MTGWKTISELAGQATGPDKHLDRVLTELLLPPQEGWVQRLNRSRRPRPRFSKSADLVVAVMAALQPDWRVGRLYQDGERRWHAQLILGKGLGWETSVLVPAPNGRGYPTPALALLAALSLIMQG